MRKHLYAGLAAAALLLFPVREFAFQQAQAQQAQPQSSQPGAAQQPDSQGKAAAQTSQSAPAQKDSLAAAARRARDEKKDQPKPTRVFTNDNVPTTGGISAVGQTPAAEGADGAAAAEHAAPSSTLANDEKTWRERFSKLRHKLEQDQQELDVMQRELGVLDVQYYNNPVKAMQQDLTRSDINKKTSDIDAKKALIAADKQAISDAEDELRKAGGDSGWAR